MGPILGGIKLDANVASIFFRDLPLFNSALFGLVSYNDPCRCSFQCPKRRRDDRELDLLIS